MTGPVIDSLKDKDGVIVYPKTATKAVYKKETNENLDILLDKKADKTYVDNKVKTDVPENAVFTDTNTTYTEITTAEIDAGTASTLRTITGRRVKYILDKVQGWIGGLTKSDVGLSNVDNIKQATKVEFDEHLADDAPQAHLAKSIGLEDVEGKFVATNLEGAMNELFTNVSNGKQLVGGAITDVDDSIVIPADPTFNDLASAIGNISSGKKWASGTYKHTGEGSSGSIRGLSFIPSLVISISPSSSATKAFKWIYAPGELAYYDYYTRISLIEDVYGFDWAHYSTQYKYETYTWLAIE